LATPQQPASVSRWSAIIAFIRNEQEVL